MSVKQRKYQITNFLFCVFFVIVSGCHSANKPQISFQRVVDKQQRPYQFSALSFVPEDIQSLKVNNLELNSAETRIIQAQALYAQAYAGYLPQITTDIAGNRQKGANAFNFQPTDITLYSVNAQVSLVPDFFGRTKLRTLIADNQQQAQYLQAQATYLDILNGYAKNYHLVCSTKALLEIHKNTVTTNQNMADSLEIRYKLGRSNIVDYYNARDNVLSAQIALNDAQQNYNLALQSYYTLIGQSLENNHKISVLCDKGLPVLPQQKLVMNLQDIDNRPDIQAIQYNLKTAYNNLDLSLKALYPDTSLLFSVQNFTDSVTNILDINGFTSNFIAQLTQLIYDGGIREANIDISEADVSLAKHTYRNSVITAGNHLITLGKNLNLAMNLETQAENRLKMTTKAFDAANRNYRLGNVSFIDLLNSQRNNYVAQLELVFLQQNLRNLYVDLLTASGIAPIKDILNHE